MQLTWKLLLQLPRLLLRPRSVLLPLRQRSRLPGIAPTEQGRQDLPAYLPGYLSGHLSSLLSLFATMQAGWPSGFLSPRFCSC